MKEKEIINVKGQLTIDCILRKDGSACFNIYGNNFPDIFHIMESFFRNKDIKDFNDIIKNGFDYLNEHYEIHADSLKLNIFLYYDIGIYGYSIAIEEEYLNFLKLSEKNLTLRDANIRSIELHIKYFFPEREISFDEMDENDNYNDEYKYEDHKQSLRLHINIAEKIISLKISNINIADVSSIDSSTSATILDNVEFESSSIYQLPLEYSMEYVPLKFYTNHLIIENTIFKDLHIDNGDKNQEVLFFQHLEDNLEDILYTNKSPNDYKITARNCIIDEEIYKREKRPTDHHLKEIVFEDCIFKNKLILENLCFYKLSFFRCEFKEEVSFEWCYFGNIEIMECIFYSNIYFTSCYFYNAYCICKSIFNSTFFVNNSSFDNNFILRLNTFKEDINLSENSFASLINISSSSIKNIIMSSIYFLNTARDHIWSLYKYKYDIYDYKKYFESIVVKLKDYDKLENSHSTEIKTYNNYINPYNVINDFKSSVAIIKSIFTSRNDLTSSNIFSSLENLIRGYQLKQMKSNNFNEIWHKCYKQKPYEYTNQLNLYNQSLLEINSLVGKNKIHNLFINFYKKILSKKYNLYIRALESKIKVLNSRMEKNTCLDYILLFFYRTKFFLIPLNFIKVISSINLKLYVDRFLLWINNKISDNHQNAAKAVGCLLGLATIRMISNAIMISWKSVCNTKDYGCLGRNIFNILVTAPSYLDKYKFIEIVFPYGVPTTIEVGLVKLISIYIIWQIIKSSRKHYK